VNPNHLQVFLTVAKVKNFSRAGKKLHLSQPTITQIIKQLEQELETRLFDRTTHSVQLTESGKLLIPYAEKILRLQEEARRKIALLEQTISGPLLIGASMTSAEAVLPRLMGQYQQRYPNVQIRIEVTNSENIMTALEAGQLHFGIIEAPLTSSVLAIQPLMTDELVCIASANHPPEGLTAEPSGIHLQQLATLPLIMREKGSGTRLVLEEALAKCQIPAGQLHIVMELNSTEAIKEMVANGLGVAVLSRHLIKKELELGLLTAYSLQPKALLRSFYYAYLPEEPLRPAVMAMLQLIREQPAQSPSNVPTALPHPAWPARRC